MPPNLSAALRALRTRSPGRPSGWLILRTETNQSACRLTSHYHPFVPCSYLLLRSSTLNRRPTRSKMSSTDPMVRQAALRRILMALMDKPCQIEECLYIGSAAAAGRKHALNALNITHVLIVARALEPSFPGEFEYKKVDVADSPAEDLLRHFDDCFGFIERARQGGGGVLVHCFAGVSRSAAVVMAYLMRKRGLSRPEAMALVVSKRPRVAPNDGFVAQLDRYEKAIRGSGETEEPEDS